MKNILYLLVSCIILASCGTSKTATTKQIVVNQGIPNRIKTIKRKKVKDKIVVTTTVADEVITEGTNEDKIEGALDVAKSFEGTPYKYGGTTKEGMDCSGLVFTAYGSQDVVLPRVSREMAKKGVEVPKQAALEGDLIFFRTSRRRKGINHVGIVEKVKNDEIFFIHASTSNGVMISSLEESYWKNAFVEIRRII